MRVPGACLVIALCFLAVGCARPTVAPPDAARPGSSLSPLHRDMSPPQAPLAAAHPAALSASPSPAATGAAIYFVSATPKVAQAGDTIVWDVRTGRDVTSVSASAFGVTIPLERQSSGHFRATFRIPAGLPAIFRRTYSVAIEARNAARMTAVAHVSLRLN